MAMEQDLFDLLADVARREGRDINDLIQQLIRTLLRERSRLPQEQFDRNHMKLMPSIMASPTAWIKHVHDLSPAQILKERNLIYALGGMYDQYLDLVREGKDHKKSAVMRVVRYVYELPDKC